MTSKLKIPQEMLMNIDFINTVNGGMSEPAIQLKKGDDGFDVFVRVPGIDVEDLEVEVVEGKQGKKYLKIFHFLPIFSQESIPDNEQWKSIRFINTIVIPDGVDTETISARYDEPLKQVILHLPFRNEQGDYRRKVDINKW